MFKKKVFKVLDQTDMKLAAHDERIIYTVTVIETVQKYRYAQTERKVY